MLITTVFKHVHDFEVWAPVVEGSKVKYVKTLNASGTMVPAGAGAITLFAVEQINNGSQVRNLRDTEGTAVLQASGVAYPMYVNDAVPQLDALGRLVGWRHTLRRTRPRDLDDLYDQIGALTS